MEISEEIFNRMACLKLSGRLDIHGAQELQHKWSVLQKQNILCAALDMSGVDYLSSAGLRILIMMLKTLKQRGGGIALSGLNNYCREVIEMAGFSGAIKQTETLAQATAFCETIVAGAENLDRWDDLETAQIDCGSFRFMPESNEAGVINVLGDIKNILYARVQESDVCSKRFYETEYSIGLGGLGDQTEDFFPIMGEMITIGGTMVWLPTDGYDTPDFLIPKTDKGQVTIRTVFNVSISGRFNELIYFESTQEGGTPVNILCRALFTLSQKRRKDYKGVLGFAMRAQVGRVLGSGIKKSPIKNYTPSNGLMIVHPDNLGEWFDSDTAPRHENVTALICGVGVDLGADLSQFDQEMFNRVFYLHPSNIGGKTELLHNHAVIFQNIPMPERPTNLEQEIRALVDEGEFFDMRHLLDSSSIEKALIGVSYIQQFHPDENG